jgi:hypothetical protein
MITEVGYKSTLAALKPSNAMIRNIHRFAVILLSLLRPISCKQAKG